MRFTSISFEMLPFSFQIILQNYYLTFICFFSHPILYGFHVFLFLFFSSISFLDQQLSNNVEYSINGFEHLPKQANFYRRNNSTKIVCVCVSFLHNVSVDLLKNYFDGTDPLWIIIYFSSFFDFRLVHFL